jgi:predicted CopG family antitoxin
MRKVNFTKHIGLLITEETYRHLVKITNEKEMPLSQFIRDVLEEKLDQAEEGTGQ